MNNLERKEFIEAHNEHVLKIKSDKANTVSDLYNKDFRIVLDKKYEITVFDDRNLVLKSFDRVKNLKTGKYKRAKEWKFVGYYGKMEWLLNALLELKLKKATIKSIEDMKVLIVDFKKEIKGITV